MTIMKFPLQRKKKAEELSAFSIHFVSFCKISGENVTKQAASRRLFM